MKERSTRIATESKSRMVQIVDGPIDRETVLGWVSSAAAGAIAAFEGVVRNHARGKSVTHLYYEAYRPMAIKELLKVREEALKKWPVEEIAIVHRLGKLKIGEPSVLIAVSAPHRGDAFEACRFAIDTLKSRVPIWKKEFYEDGEIWIEGYTESEQAGSTT